MSKKKKRKHSIDPIEVLVQVISGVISGTIILLIDKLIN